MVEAKTYLEKVRTDEDGFFQIDGLYDAETFLSLCDSESSWGEEWTWPQPVRPGEVKLVVNVPRDVVPSASFGAWIVGPDGQVSIDASIELSRIGSGRAMRLRSTDTPGELESGLIPPGVYALSLQWPGHPVQPLERLSLNADDNVDLGTIRAGRPGSLLVEIRTDESLNPERLCPRMRLEGQSFSVDIVEGEISVPRLAPGPYILSFRRSAWRDVPFEIDEDQRTELVVPLTKGTLRYVRFEGDLDACETLEVEARDGNGLVFRERLFPKLNPDVENWGLWFAPGVYRITAQTDSGVRFEGEVVVDDLRVDDEPIVIPRR